MSEEQIPDLEEKVIKVLQYLSLVLDKITDLCEELKKHGTKKP